MGSPSHFGGKGFAPSHSSVTEGAKPIVEALRKLCTVERIRVGMIQSNLGARCFSVKLANETGAVKVTVVTNGKKQELYLYGAPPLHEIATKLREDKSLGRRYIIKT